MKKNIKIFIRIICFVLVFVLGLAIFTNFLSASKIIEYPARCQFWQNINAEDDNTIDVIFTGDSSISNAVSPTVLWENTAITSYDIGYSVMVPRESYYELKKLFKTQSPKVVFIDIAFLVDTKAKEKKYGVAEMHNKIDYVEDELFERINSHFPIMKNKAEWSSRGISDLIHKHPEKINNFYKGYFYSKEVQSFNRDDLKSNDGVAEFIHNGDKYFDKIYNLCKNNDCKVVLVAVPHITGVNQKMHDKTQELANKYNVDFIDYNFDENRKIDDFSWSTDTKDGGMHLNFSGATKTTKAIGDYLVNELGMEPTKLTKEQAEKWDNDTKLFYEAIKNQQ